MKVSRLRARSFLFIASRCKFLVQLQLLRHRVVASHSSVRFSCLQIAMPTIMSQLALAMVLVTPPAAAAVPGARARVRVRTPLLLSGGAASSPVGDVPFRVAYDANSELEDDENYEVDNLLFVGM
eukprot:scaffold100126_cov48-Phaeocystis_antarctica.AAC.3